MRADVSMTVPPETDDQVLENRRVLIVEPVPEDLPYVASRTPFVVTVAESFADAKTALTTTPPDLLITRLRLGAFNGLHLVLRGKTSRPDMAAIVLSDASEGTLRGEAEALGATFVVLPIASEQLLAVIQRSLSPANDGPIRPPYERRVAVRRRDMLAVASDRRVKDRRRHLVL